MSGPLPPAPVGPDEFRAAVQGIAGAVAVVSTQLRRTQHAITATSFTWVSVEPPLLLVCVHEDARFLDAVEETGTWGLSLLTSAQRASAAWLATPGRPAVGQLARVPHAPGPVTGVPLLTGALATFECRTTAAHPGGDHVIVVGEVVSTATAAAPAGGVGGGAAGEDPLIRFRGSYRRLA